MLREQFEGPAPEQPASIVSFLLLDRPIDLPSWPGRVHRIETPEDADPFAEMSDLIQRTVRTRIENIETVFVTLEDGATTISEVMKRTGLGKKVVQRAMVALENDGRIVRHVPAGANQHHRFSVINRALHGAQEQR